MFFWIFLGIPAKPSDSKMKGYGIVFLLSAMLIVSRSAAGSSETLDGNKCQKLTQPWLFSHLSDSIKGWVIKHKRHLSNAPKAMADVLSKSANEARNCIFLADRHANRQTSSTDAVNARLILSFFEEGIALIRGRAISSEGLWHRDTLPLLKSLKSLLDENADVMLSAGRSNLGTVKLNEKSTASLEGQCASKAWRQLSCQHAFELHPMWRQASCEETDRTFGILLNYLTRLDLAQWLCTETWSRDDGATRSIMADIIQHGKRSLEDLATQVRTKRCKIEPTISAFARLAEGPHNEPGTAAIAQMVLLHPKVMAEKHGQNDWAGPAFEEIRVEGRPCVDRPDAADAQTDEIFQTTRCVAAMRRGDDLTCKCQKLIVKHHAESWPIDERGNFVDLFSDNPERDSQVSNDVSYIKVDRSMA